MIIRIVCLILLKVVLFIQVIHCEIEFGKTWITHVLQAKKEFVLKENKTSEHNYQYRWDTKTKSTEVFEKEGAIYDIVVEQIDRNNYNFIDNKFEYATLNNFKSNEKLLKAIENVKYHGVHGERVGLNSINVISEVLFSNADKESSEEIIGKYFESYGSYQIKDCFTIKLAARGFVRRNALPLGKIPNAEEMKTEFASSGPSFHIDVDLQGNPISDILGPLMIIFKLPYFNLVNLWIPISNIPVQMLGLADPNCLMDQDSRLKLNVQQGLVPKKSSIEHSKISADLFAFNPLYFNNTKYDSYITKSNCQTKTPFVVDSNLKFGEALIFSSTDTMHSSIFLPSENVLFHQYKILECYLLFSCKDEFDNLIKKTANRIYVKASKEERAAKLNQLLDEYNQLTINKKDFPAQSYNCFKTADKQIRLIKYNNYDDEIQNKDEILSVLKGFQRMSLELRSMIILIPHNHALAFLSVFVAFAIRKLIMGK